MYICVVRFYLEIQGQPVGRGIHGLRMKALLEWKIRNEKLEMVVRRKKQ